MIYTGYQNLDNYNSYRLELVHSDRLNSPILFSLRILERMNDGIDLRVEFECHLVIK